MKINLPFFFSVSLALASLSCIRNVEPEDLSDLSFKAVWEDNGTSKTILSADGPVVLWSGAESINVFRGTSLSGRFSASCPSPQPSATFSGGLQGSSAYSDEDPFWAAYPYDKENSFSGSDITISMPDVQLAAAGSFENAAMPGIACSGSKDLTFYFLGGGLRFSVSQKGINRVIFSSADGSALSGRVRVAPDGTGEPVVKGVVNGKPSVTVTAPAGGFVPGTYYYVCLLPGSFSGGLKLQFTNSEGLEAVKELPSVISINRGVFSKQDRLDLGVSFKPETPSINGTELLEGNDLVGLITDKDTGKGIPGVVVSDGYDCVASDSNGVYQFKSNKLTRLVYISVPSEYKVPVDSYKSIPVFYVAVTSGGSVLRNDFTLEALTGGKESKWTFIGIGDPQCATASNASRYKNETLVDITQTFAGRSGVYAMTLGDIVFDNTKMWPTMKNYMGNISTGAWSIPFFQTIGNHDHDSLKPDTADNDADDYNATSSFEAVFGPANYSFNRGDVHVVSMDDIIVKDQKSSSKENGKTWNYAAGFTKAQLEWLKKDLELVPDKAEKMIFLCCHIPFRSSTTNYFPDVMRLMTQFKEAHLMIGHTHYTQNYIHTGYRAQGGLAIYEHIHGSACGSWWTSACSSTVTGEPSGYTCYEIEGPHIKDWMFKGTNKKLDDQLRVFDGNELYYQSKSYPLNWYTASQKAGSSSITVKGNANLAGSFVAQLYNDDDTYWKVDLVRKSSGATIGSFKRLSNGACTNVAMSAFYFNVKNKNSDSYSSKTASHYWYYKPASGKPAEESDWEVVVTHTLPGGDAKHVYRCSKLTKESDFAKAFYF